MFKRKNHLLFSALLLIAGLTACKQAAAEGDPTMQIWNRNKALLLQNIAAVVDGNDGLRGFSAAKTTLNVFDFDHTLSDNTTKVPVVTAAGATKALDSKCILLSDGDKPDYSVFDNENVYTTEPIQPTLTRLRGYVKYTSYWNVVLTARGGRRTFPMIQEYLWQRGAEPDVVIAANFPPFHKSLWEKIEYPGDLKKLPRGAKKSLLIAALVELAKTRGANIEKVRYFEDTDEYLAGTMVLLPRLFPELKFEFFDYVRKNANGKAKYSEVAVATFEAGKLSKADGTPLTAAAEYDSGDCPKQ
jgi:hypothetical protein